MRIITLITTIIASAMAAVAQIHVTPYENLVRGIEYEQDSIDYTRARQLYEAAAEEGETRAMNNLAVMYAFGCGVDENVDKAVALLYKAAMQGDAFAMENYGMCMMIGYGMPVNEKGAVPWFTRAEDAGYYDLCNSYTYRIRTEKYKGEIVKNIHLVIYTKDDLLFETW